MTSIDTNVNNYTISELLAILQFGIIGETYNVGGLNEKRNIDVILEM